HLKSSPSSTRKTLWQFEQLVLTVAWAFLAWAWVTPSLPASAARPSDALMKASISSFHFDSGSLTSLAFLAASLISRASLASLIMSSASLATSLPLLAFLKATGVRTALVMAKFFLLIFSMIFSRGVAFSSSAEEAPAAASATATMVTARADHFRFM